MSKKHVRVDLLFWNFIPSLYFGEKSYDIVLLMFSFHVNLTNLLKIYRHNICTKKNYNKKIEETYYRERKSGKSKLRKRFIQIQLTSTLFRKNVTRVNFPTLTHVESCSFSCFSTKQPLQFIVPKLTSTVGNFFSTTNLIWVSEVFFMIIISGRRKCGSQLSGNMISNRELANRCTRWCWSRRSSGGHSLVKYTPSSLSNCSSPS